MQDKLDLRKGNEAVVFALGAEVVRCEVVKDSPHGLVLRSRQSYYYGVSRSSLKNRLKLGQAVTVLIPGKGHVGCSVRHLGRDTGTLKPWITVVNPDLSIKDAADLDAVRPR